MANPDLLIMGIFWGLSLLLFALGLGGPSKRGILSLFAGFMWIGITLSAIGSGGSTTLSCSFCTAGTTFTLTPEQIFFLSFVGVIFLILGAAKLRGKI